MTQQAALRDDPRFASVPLRAANWAAMMQIVELWTRSRSVAECLRLLEAAGVPCAPYNEPGDALQDAHLQARGLFAPVQDGGGDFVGLNAPWQMSASGTALGGQVPGLGQHSATVLQELLGLGEAELAALRSHGAFGQPCAN